ncbi:hypothetical protein CBS101457_003458 [Exobasidium rhododendri]|nr:hypothetical protein CBS101457_003458 [Exobasidium rhododendri]
MPKSFSKVVYKPDHTSGDIFQVIVNAAEYQKWKDGDKTIPLAEVVDAFEIFITGQGAQGIMGRPSKQQLDSAFGTHNDTDVVTQILEKGDMQSASSKDGFSTTNDSKSGTTGAGGGHGGR